MRKVKVNWLTTFLGLIVLALGIVLVALKEETLTKGLFMVIGFSICTFNFVALISSLKRKDVANLIASLVYILFGVLLIFFHQTFLRFVIAIGLVIFPLIRVFLAGSNYYVALKEEFPRFILAILLFVLTPEAAIGIMIKVIGIVIILFGLLLLIGSFALITYEDVNNKEESQQ